MTLDKNTLFDFIQSAESPVTKRELARAFGIKGGENRVALKQILRQLEADGVIAKFAGGAYGVPKRLPSAGIVEVTEISFDGDVIARPLEWNEELQGETPRIEIVPDKKSYSRLKEGSRALVRFSRLDQTLYEGRIIKALDNEKGRILGLVRIHKNGAILQPANKKAKYDFDIATGDLNGAKDGDLALGEIQPERGMRNKKVRIVEVIGRRDDPKAISIISLHESGLSEIWPEKVLEEAQKLSSPELAPCPSKPEGRSRKPIVRGSTATKMDPPVKPEDDNFMKNREDLRNIPLVTIDGADARDFDDAVFAEKQDNGGFHLIVAIADVSYYVRPGSALDTEARRRGNSTYFPDRVVPMLPEALSNDLCSLRPDVDRACLAAHLWIDQHGHLTKYKFVRGLMRSHARLVYEQVQAFVDIGSWTSEDGQKAENLQPLTSSIQHLYDAYHVLDKARRKRGALDLDLPERKIIIDEDGNMTGVTRRERLDSHKLIEEFMILANVAAAKALEDKQNPKLFPCVYRVHEPPSLDKLDSVREFVESFGLSLAKGQVPKPLQLNKLLEQAAKLPYSHLISQVLLRAQSQAHYTTDNGGHFGLALNRYAHFTSPIRRYADLLIHRALVSAYKLGPGGLDERDIARIDEICQNISSTERTSMEAERNATDRFCASYLATQINAEFAGKISGVTRFGLFVTLDESGADGLVPMKSLADDFYIHDEDAHALIGKRHRRVFRLGSEVTVKLTEADPLTGSTLLQLTGESLKGADIPGMKLKPIKTKERPQKKRYKRGKVRRRR